MYSELLIGWVHCDKWGHYVKCEQYIMIISSDSKFSDIVIFLIKCHIFFYKINITTPIYAKNIQKYRAIWESWHMFCSPGTQEVVVV